LEKCNMPLQLLLRLASLMHDVGDIAQELLFHRVASHARDCVRRLKCVLA
jgi:hypothetical protein